MALQALGARKLRARRKGYEARAGLLAYIEIRAAMHPSAAVVLWWVRASACVVAEVRRQTRRARWKC